MTAKCFSILSSRVWLIQLICSMNKTLEPICGKGLFSVWERLSNFIHSSQLRSLWRCDNESFWNTSIQSIKRAVKVLWFVRLFHFFRRIKTIFLISLSKNQKQNLSPNVKEFICKFFWALVILEVRLKETVSLKYFIQSEIQSMKIMQFSTFRGRLMGLDFIVWRSLASCALNCTIKLKYQATVGMTLGMYALVHSFIISLSDADSVRYFLTSLK